MYKVGPSILSTQGVGIVVINVAGESLEIAETLTNSDKPLSVKGWVTDLKFAKSPLHLHSFFQGRPACFLTEKVLFFFSVSFEAPLSI